MRRAIAVIPARLGSTRLPEKVLLAATGRPMVQHVVDAARAASRVAHVVVAADHPRIAQALQPFHTPVLLTRTDHANGTSRVAEALDQLRRQRALPAGMDRDDAIIVNLQADEPDIAPSLIDTLIETIAASSAPAATLAAPIDPPELALSTDVVKVVRRRDGRALYFSRSPIPFRAGHAADPHAADLPLRHIGVYAYRRWLLVEYPTLEPTPLERAERLEQLRLLEHGYDMMVAKVRAAHSGIDTADQYEAFVRRYRARATNQAAAESDRA